MKNRRYPPRLEEIRLRFIDESQTVWPSRSSFIIEGQEHKPSDHDLFDFLVQSGLVERYSDSLRENLPGSAMLVGIDYDPNYDPECERKKIMLLFSDAGESVKRGPIFQAEIALDDLTSWLLSRRKQRRRGSVAHRPSLHLVGSEQLPPAS